MKKKSTTRRPVLIGTISGAELLKMYSGQMKIQRPQATPAATSLHFLQPQIIFYRLKYFKNVKSLP